ncbi:MAG TPA: helix-turn-helix domain-containing protein [Bacteroidales bacterium]
MMNQPELGKKICEIRNEKGVTQKDLSESCNIDIRTIQRIESGDVIPRFSTLKLIASSLDVDMTGFNGNTQRLSISFIRSILPVFFIAGIINFVNWFFYTGLFPELILRYGLNIFVILSVIYAFSIALIYYGFYYLGKYQGNKLLSVISVIVIILTYLYVVTDLIIKASAFPPYFIYINKLILYISNVNGILFGIALIMAKSRYTILYKVTGIFHIMLVPLFFFSAIQVIIVACCLAALYFMLLTVILFAEYRFYKQAKVQM